jgi:hypothetical protein
MFANVYVYNNKYVYTRPKTCYYVVYEMWNDPPPNKSFQICD